MAESDSMFDRYIEIEKRLFGQEARAVARTLIAVQVFGAPLLLILGNGESDIVRGVVMLLGAAAIVAGVRLLRRSPTLGKLTIGAGGTGTILFIGAIEPFLGAVALVIYMIVLLVSLVA